MLKRITLLCLLLFCLGKINAQSTLNVKAFVQGYYNSLSQTMVPIIDPVSQPNVFDTIRIELHDNSGNLVYSFPALFDINGNAFISIPPIYLGNTYYIVLRHRNSIETWSTVPLLITNNANYDFTTGINQAHGNNMILLNNTSCIYSGDINQDGIIDTTDINIILDSSNSFAFGYYYSCDLNGDGAVDVLDIIIVDYNHGVHAIIPVFTSVNAISLTNKDFIFPNPANNSIFISAHQHQLKARIYIYSVIGDLVKTINNLQEDEKINISELSSGSYIIQLKDSEHIFTQKLIVEN